MNGDVTIRPDELGTPDVEIKVNVTGCNDGVGIKDITITGGAVTDPMAGNVYTLNFKLSDGTEKPIEFIVPQGVSVTGAEINAEGHLIITKSDGQTIDAGKVDAENLSTATNLVNGIAVGSLRSVTAKPETDEYKLGHYATALGTHTTAEGDGAFSMGNGCSAIGTAAFASGGASIAIGAYSHTEGFATQASGKCAHSEGYGNTAFDYCQHVQGKYCDPGIPGKYAHIVGNGDKDKSSNAHTLDWQGNAWFAGDVIVGGKKQEDADAKVLATREYVNDMVGKINIPDGVKSWNDLEDKPFGEVEKEGYILPETTIEIIPGQGTGYITDKPSATPIIGGTYTVNWNGAEYECVAQAYEDSGITGAILGNAGAVDAGEATEDPFVIILLSIDIDGMWGLIAALDGSTAPTFSIFGRIQTVKRLDNKYIPENIKPAFFAKYANDGNGYQLIDGISYANIYSAAMQGRTVYLYEANSNEIVGTLVAFEGDYASFAGMALIGDARATMTVYTVDENGIVTRGTVG